MYLVNMQHFILAFLNYFVLGAVETRLALNSWSSSLYLLKQIISMHTIADTIFFLHFVLFCFEYTPIPPSTYPIHLPSLSPWSTPSQFPFRKEQVSQKYPPNIA